MFIFAIINRNNLSNLCMYKKIVTVVMTKSLYIHCSITVALRENASTKSFLYLVISNNN